MSKIKNLNKGGIFCLPIGRDESSPFFSALLPLHLFIMTHLEQPPVLSVELDFEFDKSEELYRAGAYRSEYRPPNRRAPAPV